MIALPNSYYTTQMLEGNPEQTGIKQPAPQFYQGEDIQLQFYLNYNGAPVISDKYVVDIIVKKSTAAQNVLWKATLGNGLYELTPKVPGYYYISMPAAISSLFLPGTYYITARLKEVVGQNKGPSDLTIFMLNMPFNIELSSASPNPKLAPTSSSETTFDIEDGYTTTITHTEYTLPLPSSITGPGQSFGLV